MMIKLRLEDKETLNKQRGEEDFSTDQGWPVQRICAQREHGLFKKPKKTPVAEPSKPGGK